MKVLLISYLFPPAGGITVQRALSLTRYLPANGCEVHVLSARNAPSPVMDPGLVALVPPSVKQHHAWTPVIPFALAQNMWHLLKRKKASSAAGGSATEPSRLMFIRKLLSPDPEVLWRPFCFRAAARIVERHKIDVVLVTAPPFSALLTGVALKKRFPGITLVSDFRDGWLDWYVNAFEFFRSTGIRQSVEKMERDVVTASDLVVSVTASLMTGLRNRYVEEPAGKFVLVPNGFDPAVLPRPHTGGSHGHDGKIVVSYMGTLYGQTSAKYYLDAVDQLPEDIRKDFETHFIGRIAADEVPTQMNRRSQVIVHGFMPQSEALEHLTQSDVLLVTMTDPLCHTGKIFEYLALGKSILAFTPPEGELGQMLQQVGGAWVVDPADSAGALRTLEQIHALRKAGSGTPAPDPALVRKYERPGLTELYASLIRDAVLRRHGGRTELVR